MTQATPIDGTSSFGGTTSNEALMTVEQLLNEAKRPRQWLVEGLLELPSVMLLVGAPKSYKSLLAQEIAVAVASGTPVLNTFAVPHQRRTIYVQEESTKQGLGRRFGNILAGRGVDAGSVNDHLWALTNTGFRLDRHEDVTHLETLVCDFNPELIVFDSLREFHDADENDSTAIMAALRPLKHLRDTFGIGILFVHHAGRNSMSKNPASLIRGSSAIWATVDGGITVNRRHGKSHVTTHLREGAGIESFAFWPVFQDDNTEFAIEVNGQRMEPVDKYAQLNWQVLNIIHKHGEADMKQLEKALTMDQRWIRERLKDLSAQGLITRNSESVARTRKYIYALTPAGESALGDARQDGGKKKYRRG